MGRSDSMRVGCALVTTGDAEEVSVVGTNAAGVACIEVAMIRRHVASELVLKISAVVINLKVVVMVRVNTIGIARVSVAVIG